MKMLALTLTPGPCPPPGVAVTAPAENNPNSLSRLMSVPKRATFAPAESLMATSAPAVRGAIVSTIKFLTALDASTQKPASLQTSYWVLLAFSKMRVPAPDKLIWSVPDGKICALATVVAIDRVIEYPTVAGGSVTAVLRTAVGFTNTLVTPVLI